MDNQEQYQGSPNQPKQSENQSSQQQQDPATQQQPQPQQQQQYVPLYQVNDNGNQQPQNMNNNMSGNQGPDNRFQGTQINHSKYKTQKCRHFENNGHCVMGDKCNFAHGDSELKEIQPNQGNNTNFNNYRGGGGNRRGGGPMRYQNQGFQNNRQQMGANQGYFQQDFNNNNTGNQTPDDNQFNGNQTPTYMSTPNSMNDQGNGRGGMYQGGRGGRGGNDSNGRGYMRMSRRGGSYQNNDRGGMGGQMNNTPSYMGGQQNHGQFNDRGGMQGDNKTFVPPQSRGNYKTELCKYFSQGNCPYSSRCSFAHGQQELKDKPVFSGNSGNGSQNNNYQGNQGGYQQSYNGGGGYQGNFNRIPQNQAMSMMSPMQGGFAGQQSQQQQPYNYQQFYQGQMQQQMPQQQMYMNQNHMNQNQQQMPGQMNPMWQQQQQLQQQQMVDPAPNRRIHIKGKDQSGNTATVRAIAVYFSPHGIGNQNVMHQLTQADMFADQGDASNVEKILIQLRMQNLIIFRDADQPQQQSTSSPQNEKSESKGAEAQ